MSCKYVFSFATLSIVIICLESRSDMSPSPFYREGDTFIFIFNRFEKKFVFLSVLLRILRNFVD